MVDNHISFFHALLVLLFNLLLLDDHRVEKQSYGQWLRYRDKADSFLRSLANCLIRLSVFGLLDRLLELLLLLSLLLRQQWSIQIIFLHFITRLLIYYLFLLI